MCSMLRQCIKNKSTSTHDVMLRDSKLKRRYSDPFVLNFSAISSSQPIDYRTDTCNG